MPELLLPGAEIDREGWNGSGPHPATGVDLFIVHTTESDGGSIEAMRNVLHDKNAEPNLLAEHRAAARGGRRSIQLVDLNRAGKALRNTSKPGETNKAGVIQLELIGRAADPVEGTTPDDWQWLGRTVIGPACRLHRIPLVAVLPFQPYPPTRCNPPQYLGRESWRVLPDGRRGVAAHQHIKENSHGDAGDLTSPDRRLGGRSPWALIVEGATGTTPTTPTEEILNMTTPAELEAIVNRGVTKAVAGLAHAGKAVACRDNRTGRVYVVSGAGKFHAANRDVLNGLAMLGQLRPVDVDRIGVIDGAKYLEPLPDLGELADDVDELVDLAAAQAADLEADHRELVAALEELTA